MGEAARQMAAEQGDGGAPCALRADLHCHCLPGLDDGPGTLAESLDLCRALVADGITDVVATPHQLGRFETRTTASTIRAAVAQLQAQVNQSQIPLRIHAGADIRIDERICTFLHEGTVGTLADNGGYLLLELPHEFYLDPRILVDRLLSEGITPIITHPERHSYLASRLAAIRQWVQQGALLQITAASITGDFGPMAQVFATQLTEEGLVAVVASDAHGASRRPPRMSAAFSLIGSKYGPEMARELFIENPVTILRGQPLVKASGNALSAAPAGRDSGESISVSAA